MYKIRNISASRSKGCMYHNHVTLASPSFSTYSIEPYICGIQLKLYEEMNITPENYVTNKKYIDELIDNKVVEVVGLPEKTISIEENKVEVKKLTEVNIQLDISIDQLEETIEQIDEVTYEDKEPIEIKKIQKLTNDPLKKKAKKK